MSQHKPRLLRIDIKEVTRPDAPPKDRFKTNTRNMTVAVKRAKVRLRPYIKAVAQTGNVYYVTRQGAKGRMDVLLFDKKGNQLNFYAAIY